MLVIKLQHANDIRRVTIDKPISFVELVELAKSLFRDALPDPFILKYKDDEGDLITVASDRELREAFRLSQDQGILKVTISGEEKKPAAPKVTPSIPQNPKKAEKSPFEEFVDSLNPFIDAFEGQIKEFLPKLEELVDDIISSNPLAKTEQAKKEEPKKPEVPKPEVPKSEPPKVPNQKEAEKVEPAKIEPTKVEVVKVEPVKAEPAKVEPVKIEPTKIEPAKVEVVKVEPAKPVTLAEEKKESPFEAKLAQLEEMGFTNRGRNIDLLVKRKGDMLRVVKDLLE
jgi:hypothetical protein